jgi:hypothetical protein
VVGKKGEKEGSTEIANEGNGGIRERLPSNALEEADTGL